jgi:hypothetical protein
MKRKEREMVYIRLSQECLAGLRRDAEQLPYRDPAVHVSLLGLGLIITTAPS